jgi:molybdate transport repressor ModE-like protein
MLDLRRVEILCTVARTGSLAATARELSYSTPAVWQHMRRLEEEVGHPLLVAHSRGVHLTAAGRILARHGEQLLRRVGQAQAELAAVHRLEAGEVRVAAFATGAAGLLPEPIAQFRAAHPAVQVALAESEPAEALQRLRDGEIDIALVFAYGTGPDDSDALEATHLLDDPLYVALPVGHALASERAITLDQLRASGWLRGRNPLAVLDNGDVSTASGAQTGLVYRGGDFLTVQRLVAAGTVVALVPRLALALGTVDREIVVRPLAGEGHIRHVFAATRRTPAPTAAAQRLLELTLHAARDLQAAWVVDGGVGVDGDDV